MLPRGNETSFNINASSRCILQALLWAARKIDNYSITSTSINPIKNANPSFQSLKVYNTPSNNYDVVNK